MSITINAVRGASSRSKISKRPRRLTRACRNSSDNVSECSGHLSRPCRRNRTTTTIRGFSLDLVEGDDNNKATANGEGAHAEAGNGDHNTATAYGDSGTDAAPARPRRRSAARMVAERADQLVSATAVTISCNTSTAA